MIASVLTLSRQECHQARITDAYSVHRVVYSLFPAQESGRDFLYSDQGESAYGRQVLLLSSRPPVDPEWGRVESKPLPPTFLDHGRYGFEVTVNPTKRHPKTGKLEPVKGRDALVAWFGQKASDHGFEVVASASGVPLLDVRSEGVRTFPKGGATVTHATATFVGQLRVVDPGLFRQTFEKGLGRAKGFGFGLLKIVPLNAQN